MKHTFKAALVTVGMVAVCSSQLLAQAPRSSAAAPAVIAACSLMSKEEVKRHLPWAPQLDQFGAEEEALGSYGSACEYPSVRVQVIPFAQATMDEIRKKTGIETISGVGDEAYLHNNRNRYAELYVKVGARVLTLQASINGTIDEVKPGTLALATALVPKLR